MSTLSISNQPICGPHGSIYPKASIQNKPPQCFPAFTNQGFSRITQKIYTTFFSIESISLVLDVYSSLPEQPPAAAQGSFHSETHLAEAMLQKNLGESMTFELANRQLFYSIEEGKKVFDLFHGHHLDRGLSIRRNVRNRLWFNSHPRSGTNLVQKVLEEVLGEFIQSGVGQYFGPFDDNVISGELKGTLVKEITGIVRFHLMVPTFPWLLNQEKLISKVISLMRSPILSLDSYFHLSMTSHEHYCKLVGEYQHTPGYAHFLEVNAKEASYSIDITLKMASLKNIPVVYVRYEDVLMSPVEQFCNIISLYSGVPCELTHKSKLERHIEENGLSSFYKKREVERERLLENLALKFSKKNIEIVFNVTSYWLEDFGYRCQYEEALFQNCQQSSSQ